MERVAKHLCEETLKRNDDGGRDWFGRTTFNRFYYASFLEVRDRLLSISDGWKATPHKGIPELLGATIERELRRGIGSAKRTGDKETLRACSDALTSAKTLAELLKQAYATRVVADYHVEIKVGFSRAGSFELNSVPIETAKGWPHKARALSLSIASAWRQIHE